jgi:hypothetical protein
MVQGLTPAQQSLASSWGLLRLFSIQDFSDFAGGEEDPQEEECVSTKPENRLDLHLLAGSMEALTALTPRTNVLTSLQLRRHQGEALSPDRLNIFLCRFTC